MIYPVTFCDRFFWIPHIFPLLFLHFISCLIWQRNEEDVSHQAHPAWGTAFPFTSFVYPMRGNTNHAPANRTFYQMCSCLSASVLRGPRSPRRDYSLYCIVPITHRTEQVPHVEIWVLATTLGQFSLVAHESWLKVKLNPLVTTRHLASSLSPCELRGAVS